VKLSEKGTYDATIDGDLTIHNVTKKLSAKGTLEVVQDGINANSKFTLQPEDFNITIPSVVRNNIAKTIEVSVIMKYAAVGK
jgi:polyisoprenoid-binding protein YceI